ncbi:MAG: O-antigen ligase family protein [Anaerolineae bacterium]|nr:O-antigen ligase family protein [Anaerolineae bacterium]
MRALSLRNPKQTEYTKAPKLIEWLLIGIVITMPYQRTIVFPALRQGYIVDLLIMAFIALGWLIIYWRRQPIRLPTLGAHLIILFGSILGIINGLNRPEAMATLINDIYVWVLFYTAINLIYHRTFVHKLIKVWVIVAVLESLIIIYAVTFTADQKPGRGSAGNEVAVELQQVGSELEGGGPSLAEIPSEHKQAKHILKRLGRNAELKGQFFVPGTGLGTFANGDFTANYLASSIFIALAAPWKRRKWLWKGSSVALITAACFFTGVSSQLPVIPVVAALYVLLVATPRVRLFTIVASGAVIAWALLALVATPYMTGTDFFHWISQSSSESIAAGIGGISSGLEDRLALVSEGWAEYREHPMGLGPHGMRSSGVEKNVHNEYLAYLYERSIIGLVGLMLLHLTIIVMALWSMRTGDHTHKLVMAGLLAAYCQFVINDLAHELLRQRDMWMLAVLVVSYASLELRRVWLERRAQKLSQYPWAFAEPVAQPPRVRVATESG